MGPLAESQKSRFTYEDYLQWDDAERWELIDGEAYNMTSAPNRSHQAISREILRQFANFLLDKPCEVFNVPFDVRLPQVDEADAVVSTVVQPDIVVVCDPHKLDDAGCRVAPDLVIEILSPLTARKDCKEKFLSYERAGVREYWLVEPVGKTVSVFLMGSDGRCGRPEVYADDEPLAVSVLPGLIIELPLVFRD